MQILNKLSGRLYVNARKKLCCHNPRGLVSGLFECNPFHLNIANNSTNNSLGQNNKLTEHSLYFVTPKTENFIEGKKDMRNLEISATFNHGILPFHHANKSNEYQNFGSKQTNDTSLNHHLNQILCFVAGLKQKTWVD